MCPIGDRCDICREMATTQVHWPAWAAKLCSFHAIQRVADSEEAGNPPVLILNIPVSEESSCLIN